MQVPCCLLVLDCCSWRSKAHVALPLPESLLPAFQRRQRPLAGYMSVVQTDVHPGMRSILVDWLVEVSLVSLIRQLNHPSRTHI